VGDGPLRREKQESGSGKEGGAGPGGGGAVGGGGGWVLGDPFGNIKKFSQRQEERHANIKGFPWTFHKKTAALEKRLKKKKQAGKSLNPTQRGNSPERNKTQNTTAEK